MWASLPLSAKAVFPVIAVHCDKYGECWPSQKRIAQLAGYTEKSVREGIKALKRACFSGFETSKVVKEGMRWATTIYFVDLCQNTNKGYFPFHKSLITKKKWSRLTHSAQALYPVMRCFGYNDSYGRKYRRYDFCNKDKSFLAELSGISYRSMDSALTNLQCVRLIKNLQKHSAWRVYVD